MYRNCPLIVAIIGFVFLLLGIVCSWYAFPKLIEYEINKNIALREGTLVYDYWKKQPFPLKFKVYLFNVTNPDEIQLGANPIVKELGPYVYDQYWERVDVEVNEDADTLKYMLRKTFYYNQKESACRDQDEMVTILNAGVVGTALQVNLMMPTAMSVVNDAIPHMYPGIKDVFLRSRVRDILFDGVKMACHDPEIEFICGAIKGMMPPTLRSDTENPKDFLFSMFHHLNRTKIGPFEMGRGLKNTTRGELVAFDDETELDKWADDTCNMINGTDSGVFAPLKTKPDRLYAFSADICRSSYVNFEKEVVKFGIPTWRFTNKAESFANSTENVCFCPLVKNDDFEEVPKCPQSGLVDITPCVKGPVYVSYPHFYLGERSLVDYVTGLQPEKELHESYMYFEPKTGTPLEGAKRIQMNAELKRFADFSLLNNVSEGIFPILWIEEGTALPDDALYLLTSNFAKLDILTIIKWFLTIGGITLMISSFVLVMYREKLMCFSNCGTGKVIAINNGKNIDRNKKIETISENINFNTTKVYPTAYPQVENTNMTGTVGRKNKMNAVPPHAWQN